MSLLIILILLLSATTTFCIVPLTIKLANKFGLVDNPRLRPHPAHTHTSTIPRAGGVPILLGIISPFIIFGSITNQLIAIFIGALILIIVGIWDDKKHRSPYIRLVTNCLAALIVIGTGVDIPYITNPLGGVLHLDTLGINYMLALLWIAWNTSIIGWSGGVDGQLPGFVSISALVIGLLSLRFAFVDPQQSQVTYLSFATSGAFLGFLPWNFFPQKIMPGFGGKTLAGFMLAVLSILSFSKLGTALLVLAVPMIDATFLLIKRIVSGKSPFLATSGHLHHHLLVLGWGKRQIALFYWIISAVTGIAALSLNSKQKIFAVVLVLVVVAMFILFINFFWKLSKVKENEQF